MSILVTGGAGYIGSHTCVELLQAGYDVIVVDNLANSREETLREVEAISGKSLTYYPTNLLDANGLDQIFDNHTIDAVIHFAGLKAVGESVEKPLHYYETNLLSTIQLCKAMERHGVYKLVFSSSATVYGIPEQVPVRENAPIQALNPYGRTKIMIEEILGDLAATDEKWSISLLRYFNPIGAHKSGKIGEEPSGIPNNLMPYITQVAVGIREELSVFGDDYPTEDGTCIRDYIHVVDLALGHLKALEKLEDTSGANAYNLGTGNGYSVLEVVTAFEEASGKTIPKKIVERRPGDAPVTYADASKAERELEWKAERGLGEMCEDSWRWQSHRARQLAE
ncbi:MULTISPECIES: UDP-glucose 4-epimerase GalE [Bacillaceae]|uniref:UDP-glucose 4-epimerase n=1 Tax=Alkalicoccobacillus plakortidis TaxID=444060 RepID=A0A9D5DVE4_9BACI|nr:MULTISPECIES: UDP-glucose 4-epimerase GalE [Bacillaceae]KQL58798.1 UDP-galactose-4-epimerase [Alkalicoccobacillus plakortidis]